MPDATAEILRLVGRGRAKKNRSDLAYTLYFSVFVTALVVPPVVVTVRDALSRPPELIEFPIRVLEAAPLAIATLVLTLLWSGLQDSKMRGPFRLDVPLIDWVTPLPIRRAPIVVPAFLRTTLIRALWGSVTCCLFLTVLWRTVLPMPDDTGVSLVRAAVTGFLLGLLSASIGVLLSRTDRLRPLYYLLFLILAGAAVLGAPTGVALGSGPWGWAGLLIAGPGDYAVPMTLLATVTGTAFVLALRRLPLLELRRFRSGAQIASGIRSGMWLTDANWLYTMTGEAKRADFSLRGLRRPRSRRLLVPWRDLQGILRNGPALARALPLTGLALLCSGVHLVLPTSLQVVLTALPPLCLYTAMTGLMGGARACVSDPGRARYFLQSPASLALSFGVAPLLVLTALTLAVSALLGMLGVGLPGLLWTASLLPATAAAALVGLYRGVMPDHLMLGFDTPFGNSAPLQMFAWHTSGFLGLLCVAWPVTSSGRDGLSGNLAWILVGTVLLTTWARKKGRRVIEGRHQ